jgi:hypothetical protein
MTGVIDIVLAASVIVLSLGLAGTTWLSLHRSQGFVNALFVLGGVIAYIVLADRLGFLVVGTGVMFVLMGRLEVRRRRALLIAAGFTVVVYVLFARVLLVPLPRGIIPW